MEPTTRNSPTPSLLDLHPSFGFGDRLGLATPGHILATQAGQLLPIFAQQSVREMDRTNRTPLEVMSAAKEAIRASGWQGAWGADADHLKTETDVINLANAGFTFFTIDPSDFVNNAAANLVQNRLKGALDAVVKSQAFESIGQIEDLYLGKNIEVSNDLTLDFKNKEELYRTVVKYGRAIAYAEKMSGWITKATSGADCEIEVSVDETDTPTTPIEHLFIGMELKRRGIQCVSLAPRFVGQFEKAIDYKGDLDSFELTLAQHVAIARYCGPYKISVHSGSDKFRIYPIIGRVCGNLLHVKTAGTSYLEALRVVAKRNPEAFLEIIKFSIERFNTDRATYHISADLNRVNDPVTLNQKEREVEFLNLDDGRQVMHVTFGSVLTIGKMPDNQPFKEVILETLSTNLDLHNQLLNEHLGRHIRLLSYG
ncbi:MAG: tagaturonate epimerase family protein [Candidatus Poribacteria bacterium]